MGKEWFDENHQYLHKYRFNPESTQTGGYPQEMPSSAQSSQKGVISHGSHLRQTEFGQEG